MYVGRSAYLPTRAFKQATSANPAQAKLKEEAEFWGLGRGFRASSGVTILFFVGGALGLGFGLRGIWFRG